jgi:hypothetical protein
VESRRIRIIAISIVLLAGVALFELVFPLAITPAESRKIAETGYLCRLRSVCPEYAHARHDCATAASLDRCLRIKMGEEDFSLVEACANDGMVLGNPDDMPSELDCLRQRIHDWLR